jgi:hypothetical protein
MALSSVDSGARSSRCALARSSEQPSCPTATILDVAPLLNAGALLARLAGVATSRDSVATAAPVSVGLLPVAPAIGDPRVAHATGISPDSVGARAVAALARVRSASVESLPPCADSGGDSSASRKRCRGPASDARKSARAARRRASRAAVGPETRPSGARDQTIGGGARQRGSL